MLKIPSIISTHMRVCNTHMQHTHTSGAIPVKSQIVAIIFQLDSYSIQALFEW